MKLQKRFLRKYNNKNYYKYMINIPPEVVEQAKLQEGDELEIVTGSSQTLTLKKRHDPKPNA